MYSSWLRFMLFVILSPRRLLVAGLLATFFYAALVATKARLFPEPPLRAGRAVSAASTPSGGHGVPGGTRSE